MFSHLDMALKHSSFDRKRFEGTHNGIAFFCLFNYGIIVIHPSAKNIKQHTIILILSSLKYYFFSEKYDIELLLSEFGGRRKINKHRLVKGCVISLSIL